MWRWLDRLLNGPLDGRCRASRRFLLISDDFLFRCELEAGHEGRHRAKEAPGIYRRWEGPARTSLLRRLYP